MNENDLLFTRVVIDPRPSWRRFAACRGTDPELMFPDRGAPTKQIKAMCAVCVVRTHCLEFALVNREKFGIWGGKSERERRLIRRERGLFRRTKAS